MTKAGHIRELLRPIVGDDGMLPPERWAVHGVVPAAAVAPGSVEAAAEVLARASAEGWAVEVAGSGGRTGWGRPPARLDLVVSASRLSALEHYDPEDLTASVGAGAGLEALAGRFAEHRQWLALEAPGSASTLGATVALAGAGPLRLGYGTPRDQVLGVRLVSGDGRVLDLGGQVVKNVAGYDLTRLVVGSHGTLGLVARVNVRLRGLPAADRTASLVADGPAALADAAARLREARLEPVALEVLSPRAALAAGAHAGEWLLLARWHGSREGTADAVDRARALLPGLRLLEAGEADAAWAALRRIEAGAALEARLADLPTRLGETLERARGLADGGCAVVAHAGDGIVRVLAPAVEDPERWARALSGVRAETAARGGTLVVARATPELARRVEPWGEVGPAAAIMRRLWKLFDPAGVLAPGRFVV